MYINVINIQLRNTDNICTDLYILLKPQSELGYLGSHCRTHVLAVLLEAFSTYLYLHSLKIFEFHETNILNFC